MPIRNILYAVFMPAALVLACAAARCDEAKAKPAPETVISVPVILNGDVTNITGFVIGDRMVVPVRDLFERLGARIYYDEDTKDVRIQFGGPVFLMRVGDSIVNEFYKGRYIDTFQLDPAPMIIGDKMYMPLRFFCQELRIDLEWDAKNHTVSLMSRNLKYH